MVVKIEVPEQLILDQIPANIPAELLTFVSRFNRKDGKYARRGLSCRSRKGVEGAPGVVTVVVETCPMDRVGSALGDGVHNGAGSAAEFSRVV